LYHKGSHGLLFYEEGKLFCRVIPHPVPPSGTGGILLHRNPRMEHYKYPVTSRWGRDEKKPWLLSRVALLLFLPLLPYLFVVARLSYIAFNNSSDSFLYLDIAKNIASGRGFIVSFDAYQYWPGGTHPAPPFVCVVFPVLLAGFSLFLHSVQALTFFNFLPAYVNFLLIYLIAQKLYRDKAVSLWAVFLTAAMVATEVTLLRILTEQLSLLATLVALYIFLSGDVFSRCKLISAGLLLGFGALVRSSTIYYPLVFSLALLVSRQTPPAARRKNILFFLFWSFILPVLYEGLIYVKFNTFFPQYPIAYKNYYLATYITGGYFLPQTPVVRPFLSDIFSSYTLNNMFHLGLILFAVLRLLIVFSFFRFIRVFKERPLGELIFLGLVIFQILGILFFYPYQKINEFELVRFLLLPLVALLLFGIREFKVFTERFFPNTKFFLFSSILVILLFSNIYQTHKTLEIYWQEEKIGKVKDLKAVADWVRQNTKGRDLIAASEFLYGGVYLARPVVAFPSHKLLNRNNLNQFLRIYQPRVVIFDKSYPSGVENQLKMLGYQKVKNWPQESVFLAFSPY
jgi:hypothetical protein